MKKLVEYTTGEIPEWKCKGIFFYTRYSQALWKHRDALGVSATHLDWTMVPYVRKSFWKHFRDGIKYCENDGLDSEIFTMKDTDKDRSIEDEFWKEGFPKAYKYAMDMTVKETYQAVEGFYHNANTLQSRSGRV